MKLPPLNALRAFECAARTGSFAAAGEELSVTPAAVSLQVKNLESWLGRQLFTRRANQVRLTDAGRDYYQNAAAALGEIARFTDALTESASRRPLVISAPPALAELWLPDRIARFDVQHPDVPITLRIEAEDKDLEQQGIDLRLSYGGELPDYRTQPMFQDQLVAVAAVRCDPCQTRRIAIDWGQAITSVPGWRHWSALTGRAMASVAEISAPSVPSALALVKAGVGVALLPEQVIWAAISTGQVVRCSDAFLPMPRPYVMISAHHQARSRRLIALQNTLLEGV
ncbi:LysR substrate-binding domain-containing protein [Phaeobacter sp. NW0010-22]|uniref:LysR substrate-binding domain-containing protein n=1 Tax=Phaeobacter sp. NW0010-22 TaxID=3135907 RepID=UPI00310ABFC6